MRSLKPTQLRRFLIGVAAVLLGLWITDTSCLADDAATLDSWQSGFQTVWQSDSCVQEFQSWKNYWGRVHTFYFGGDGFTGWFAYSQTILPHVTDPAAQATVSTDLTSLGRRVGGEWAKQDGCRKIRSRSAGLAKLLEPGLPALDGWENQLQVAAKKDSGNGQTVEAAAQSISKQLDALGIAAAP
jgi:hypothetical protein